MVATLCVSSPCRINTSSIGQARYIHTVADRTDHHRDDGGNDDGSRHPVKPESPHASNLGPELGNINQIRPDTPAGGLAATLNAIALLAPPPVRPGTAKRTGSTPIVSHAVRPGVTKTAPRLVGVRSGVAGVTINQNGPLAIDVAGTVTINQNGPLTIGPGETWTASAACTTGLATSGGESNTSSAGVVLNQSYAYGDGSGWIVEVRNQSAQSASYTVYAVCTAGLTGYRTVNSDVTVNPGQYGTASVDCPEGTTGRGAGVQAGVNAGIGFYEAGAVDVRHGYRGGAQVQVNNFDTRIGQFSAQAICANGTPLGYMTGGGPDLPPNGYVKATAEVVNVGDQIVNGSGGSLNPQTAVTYLTDSYPETTSDGKAAWSTWIRNTSNADTSAGAELWDAGN